MADETQPESPAPEEPGTATSTDTETATFSNTGTAGTIPTAVTPDPTPAPVSEEAGDTSTTSVETSGEPATPVVVNQFTRRGDEDALPGSWVDVVAGEYQGRRGEYVGDVSHGADGYPELVRVRTRDAENELIVVGYKDVRPSTYTGGR